MGITKDGHVGEAGKHKGHKLELLTNGKVYCNDCEDFLTWRSAETAWPTGEPIKAKD